MGLAPEQPAAVTEDASLCRWPASACAAKRRLIQVGCLCGGSTGSYFRATVVLDKHAPLSGARPAHWFVRQNPRISGAQWLQCSDSVASEGPAARQTPGSMRQGCTVGDGTTPGPRLASVSDWQRPDPPLALSGGRVVAVCATEGTFGPCLSGKHTDRNARGNGSFLRV